MGSAEELMQRLAVSKKIMDKHNGLKRGDVRNTNIPMVEEFQPTNASYNLPQEFLPENVTPTQTHDPSRPLDMDKIKNSKLPDEIKRLMMEHPISQPQQQPTTISNELIEKATRLMNQNKEGYIPESAKPKQQTQQSQPSVGGIDYKLIKKMINEAVNDALHENGLITESSEKSNEVFSFKVGKHIFEGKVTKIKKLS